MHIRRVASGRLTLVTVAAIVAGFGGAAESGHTADRVPVTFDDRAIVVLEAPSIADRIRNATTLPTAGTQRGWNAEAEASQQLLLSAMAKRGLDIQRDFVYRVTLNGFSARLGPRARAQLERTPGVRGVYPVRAVYAAKVAGQPLIEGMGLGPRPRGLTGRGVTVAVLSTGVKHDHPYLTGRVLPGIDVVSGKRTAAAATQPNGTVIESHGTKMAGIVVGKQRGSAGPGVAPGARVLPIRVLGWQKVADGSFAVVGRGDQLIAGIERAADPDGDGHVGDRVQIALVPVVEPYASFTNSPESIAIAGASSVGLLVVAAVGDDGLAGPEYGSVGGPGGSAAALTVGAAEQKTVSTAAAVVRSVSTHLGEYRARVLAGAPALAASSFPLAVTGSRDSVAGWGVLIDSENKSALLDARAAQDGDAAAVVIYGSSQALDPRLASLEIPVVRVPGEAGKDAADRLKSGEFLWLALEPAAVRTGRALTAADFSSTGLAFGGRLKPDLVAPGVGILTGIPGAESSQPTVVSGSGAAAAVVAGNAALLVEGRPGLTVSTLKSVLVGSSRPLAQPSSVLDGGAGASIVGRALNLKVAASPASVSLRAGKSKSVSVRNLSGKRRTLTLEVGGGEGVIRVRPANIILGPSQEATVRLVAGGKTRLKSPVTGVVTLRDKNGPSTRLPVAVRPARSSQTALVRSLSLERNALISGAGERVRVSFQAGAVTSGTGRGGVAPVEVLDVQLLTRGGKKLGRLLRLRHLLPGRYAIALTGRAPDGSRLPPGRYILRLKAKPVDGGPASTVQARFRVLAPDF